MYPDGDHRHRKFIRTSLAILFLTVIVFSCNSKKKWMAVDPEFSKYVEAYTTGIISKTSSIKIQLAADAPTTHPIGEDSTSNLFEIHPSVKGKTFWVDARTVEFRPANNLVPDQQYVVNFKLSSVTRVPAKFKDFTFTVQVQTPSFTLQEFGLRCGSHKDSMLLTGEINTADVENPADVEKVLNASQDNIELKISWQHSYASHTHSFTVNQIERRNVASEIVLHWNGKSLNNKIEDSKTIAIPAKGDFKVLGVIPVTGSEQYASVLFSDPIAIGQDLTGMIRLSKQEDVTYSINGSEVKIYVADKLGGDYSVTVSPGIKNSWGDTLKYSFTSNVFFENRLPSVVIQGKGNILPTSGTLVLPFEAVNLSAVDVIIIKIYENNIPQFLQGNNLAGDEDLRRVSKPIVQTTVHLNNDKTLDLHKKQKFSLDIDKFVKTEPGSIYRITIGFRQSYSLYTCQEKHDPKVKNIIEDEESGGRNIVDDNERFWNLYDNFYPDEYNWEEKDNPCYNSYFNKDRWASRNILASNIGLIVKHSGNNSMLVAASDILTTEPMKGVELQLLDYQEQIISKITTDNDGFANLQLSRKPYLLIAQKGGQKGYLKLDDGSSLPFSHFDISGDEIKNGIKGFIFGERGVWRPGDSLYINCMIEDRQAALPGDHPIEFDLFTPNGQLYRHIIQSNAIDGFNVFRTATEQSAPTGSWLAKVKVGGATFEKRLKIETVMPNRLKIAVDFGNDAKAGKQNILEGVLSAKWLFGATAKNLHAKIDASLYTAASVFPKFPGFKFSNPTTKFTTISKSIFDGTLNDEGKATIKSNVNVEDAPGMLNASMLIKVFEPGGGFSTDNVVVPFSPYTSYAGIKMPEGEKPWGYVTTGHPHSIKLLNVDGRGNLLNGKTDVEVQFYKIQWRWWWDNTGSNLSNFTQDEYNKLISKEIVHLNNGVGNWTLNTRSGEWGRYLVLSRDLKSGHTTGDIIYIDEEGWQSRASQDPTSASMLSFTSDKAKYNPGEEVSLTIPSSKGGRALISIESGTRVLRSFWQETKSGQTIVKFKAEKEMSPNVYVNVSLLQPHAQTINDLPIRMYGVIPVFVEDKNTVLKPVISIRDVIRPEVPVPITVSEQHGAAMTYCIAIVDDGLLDLTRFKTPDPHASFYSKEALGVKSWDLYDYVIGSWGGGIERVLTIGGDADARVGKPKQANRFKPVVKYLGPFHLEKGSSRTDYFTLPQYIGSVRAMVIASAHISYGNAEKTITVKKPLMILATMPRVVGPTETIKLPVTVFAMESNIKMVTVSLLSNPFLEVVGPSVQESIFTATGEQMVYFDVKVKTNTGIGKVKVTATSGNERALTEIELDIRNPNPRITSVSGITLNGGQGWNTNALPIGSLSSAKAVLEISSVPPLNLEKRLDFLIEYPHGCIEQTTSAAFPQLVLNQLTDLNDYRKAQVDRNIRSAIQKIGNFQTHEGGFSYWPGERESDDWGTNYAGHFLIEAKANGYTVSESLLQQWKIFQRTKASNWMPSTKNFYGGDLVQAYRLFLLALAKVPESGAMNRLKEFKYISPEAKWRLAAAYKLTGQDNVALQLINGLPLTLNHNHLPGITYGSDLRDDAMVLETLTLLGRRVQAAELMNTIAAHISKEEWLSTQTTAYSLIAIAKFCGKNLSGSKISATIAINGKQMSLNSNSYIKQIPVPLVKTNVPLMVTNNGNNVIYVRLINEGQPIAGDTLAVNNNANILTINVQYLSSDGKSLNVSKLQQGVDFVAKVVIKNPGKRGAYNQMALTEIFPSGWEILNSRMQEGESSFKSSKSDYQDIRDDRVYTYFNLTENETVTYYIQLNASYLGRYFLPGIYCSAMYDNSVRAGVNGKWVEVVR